MWRPFSENKFKNTILKYNNSLTPGSDKLSWRYLKVIINDKTCLEHFINITNICIDLGHWLSHFKTSNSIIILKPNKTFYDSLKMFRPIILLNTLGKLIKKVIGKRLQFQSISKNFIYPCQLSGLKQHSITDVGIILVHLIHVGWVKNLLTSTLAFDIVQFFPLLNYCLLSLILEKVGFNSKIPIFF